MIGEHVEVRILEVRGDRVRLGIVAPPEVAVHRKEVFLTIQKENRAAASSEAMGVEGALDLLGDGTAGAQHNAITWPGATRAADPAVGSSHKTGERGCPVRAEAKRGRHVG
jgi:carbon storage regulator